MIKKIIILLACFCVVTSCKKDRLKDEKSILIGKWNWIYSDHRYGWCDGDDYEEVISPTTEGDDYSIQFFKSGKLTFYASDNDVIDHFRIIFSYFTNDSGDIYSFNIKLNNKDNNNLGGRVSDILILEQFPYASEHGCEDYDHYFVKE